MDKILLASNNQHKIKEFNEILQGRFNLVSQSSLNIEEIELICGDIPAGYEKQQIIGSNFIFDIDPNFTPINLHNFWGNSVTVNSFSECHHYVEGGFRTITTTIFDIGLVIFSIIVGL